eukprot:TRINITY_DN2771_c0_g4_i1.p1 TRINITY_DN2771_c0_g4~~TRINITY_DN2771_c0_g4_i1.p1  ORF type:complete len:820 (+),score=47.07 TRINITY_DN2771_c0_g4_i1:97-2556(+)
MSSLEDGLISLQQTCSDCDAYQSILQKRNKENVSKVDLGITFLRRLWRVLVQLRAYSIVLVGLLSLGEAYFISKVGAIQGQFYELYLRGDKQAFGRAVGMTIIIYAGAVVCSSTAKWLSDFLAVRWRRTLAHKMHTLYCTDMKFYWIKFNQEQIDNPDQRLTDDLKLLCSTMGDLAYTLSAVPFNLAIYIYLVVRIYSSWTPIFIAAGFCVVGTAIQRTVMTKIANLVFTQEIMEGNLRKAQMRLRQEADSIAMYCSWKEELSNINMELNNAIINQRKIVMWSWLLGAITKTLDYTGATLNYVCLALVVFGAVWSGLDSAELASKISNASFYTLTLIYTFTRLLDASDKISMLVGLLARVTQFMEVLEQGSNVEYSHKFQDQEHASIDTTAQGYQQVIQQSQRATWHYKTQALELISPYVVKWQTCSISEIIDDYQEVEISIHSLGQDALLQEMQKCFPDAPQNSALLAIVTIQYGDSEQMDQMLQLFLKWFAGMSKALDQFWCDAVNPRNGLALNGKKGKRYSEVYAAQVLLGYEKISVDECDMLNHPTQGLDVYPVTMLTNAPLMAVKQALCRINDFERCSLPVRQSPFNVSQPALIVENVTMRTPSDKLALQNLNFLLPQGSSLLITGPSGVGKTSFLKALCGLWKFDSGRASFNPINDVEQPNFTAGLSGIIFLPQRSVCAPGKSLREQLVYGQDVSKTSIDENALIQLLRIVHLEYLLELVEDDFDANMDWEGILSPGELQKISIARVLLKRPSIVVMDEAMSALPQVTEAQLLSKIQAEGITVVCVSHRNSLEKYFDFKLYFYGDEEGRWCFS